MEVSFIYKGSYKYYVIRDGVGGGLGTVDDNNNDS